MFQRFTSLFFSDSSAPEGLEEPKPFVSQEEEEDGWLIIDLAGEKSLGDWVHKACGADSLRDGVGRPVPSPPVPCLMDESWFVTPPPCFTAEGPGLDSMESNPMEDLLIEHPSMSVYVTSNSLVVDRDSPEEISEGEVPEPRLERHVPHHSASLAVKAAILEKVSQARRVQRAKQLAEKHCLSQKALQRQNRARERPSRRAKQHGSSFVHQPCQRHCNY
ncbi:Tumor protein p53-inducible nuclear protein 2 [Tinamus guttatus]|uniref:Tumor protein p53-inducible nuclear protein 2 n=1 Tax=Tinamus guttatus TaxID=94827 RepID=A0A099ZSM7_TINGU|nr:Tumor protein p53-inducible nuclear protein 2 [Tinamus guttatus]